MYDKIKIKISVNRCYRESRNKTFGCNFNTKRWMANGNGAN